MIPRTKEQIRKRRLFFFFSFPKLKVTLSNGLFSRTPFSFLKAAGEGVHSGHPWGCSGPPSRALQRRAYGMSNSNSDSEIEGVIE